MELNFTELEERWLKSWITRGVYVSSNAETTKPKYYVLDMFPYPSGSGLHVGHPLGYIASDIVARYKRMNGFNVLHPMGFDEYGLPAEQYAITMGVHPADSTKKNVNYYREQLMNLGLSYDWTREVGTSNPNYFKWTQWIFLQLFESWYDTKANKARPISELREILATQGTIGLHAASSEDLSIDPRLWIELPISEQEDILMNYRLAYHQVTYVNYCEALGTVLANDEVKDGLSERGGYPVERRPMLQWSLRITAYAQRLLDGLAHLDWSDSMKKMQSNWIGRSTGAQLYFEIADHNEHVEVFTTRPDTIFGATYVVLAPEHELVSSITTKAQQTEIATYIAYVNTKSELDRQADTKDVTGTFTGAYAIHPFTKEPIPIWISEYVLKDYGTGAIMAVPSDDARDHRFATHFDLPIIPVIDQSDYPNASIGDKVGVLINSDFLNGHQVKDAIPLAISKLEALGIGTKKVNFKLRDAIYSRQRYWGEPIPIVYDENDVAYALPFEELPLELPEVENYRPATNGKSALARNKDWVNYKPGYRRETDTMPGFAGSSWYFLRFMDPHSEDTFASEKAIHYWRDVDLYVGGTEHAVGHLLYSRFWFKFLHDLGYVPTDEPFKKLINQGMIQGVIEYIYQQKEKINGDLVFVSAELTETPEYAAVEFVKIPVHIDFVTDYGSEKSHLNRDGIKQLIDWRPDFKQARFISANGTYDESAPGSLPEFTFYTLSETGKMSKRYFNVVNPDDVIAQYGADTFRMYEMFLGPLEQSKPWDTKGIDGVSKFLRRYWQLHLDDQNNWHVDDGIPTKEALKTLHHCIKKVQDDISRYSFNTCISTFMICVNELRKQNCHNRSILETLCQLMAPFAPFITEEIWHHLGHKGSIHHAEYPQYDDSYLVEDEVTYPISINGKKRGEATFPADMTKEEIEKEALQLDVAKKWLEGKNPKKVIVVLGRMINIVI